MNYNIVKSNLLALVQALVGAFFALFAFISMVMLLEEGLSFLILFFVAAFIIASDAMIRSASKRFRLAKHYKLILDFYSHEPKAATLMDLSRYMKVASNQLLIEIATMNQWKFFRGGQFDIASLFIPASKQTSFDSLTQTKLQHQAYRKQVESVQSSEKIQSKKEEKSGVRCPHCGMRLETAGQKMCDFCGKKL